MFERIRAWFAPNLGKVLAKFEKSILKLEKVIDHETKRIEEAERVAAAMQARKANSQATVERANNVKTNISNLLGL